MFGVNISTKNSFLYNQFLKKKKMERHVLIRRNIEFNEENKENHPVCVLCDIVHQEFLVYICFCRNCIKKTQPICRGCVTRYSVFNHICICTYSHHCDLTQYIW